MSLTERSESRRVSPAEVWRVGLSSFGYALVKKATVSWIETLDRFVHYFGSPSLDVWFSTRFVK